ncbi:MAG TPA: DUF1847 domain-containing protein, partial [Deltaproteobacteria bacterium]|nr:DUF1847 domain-containing protein [Deltaproteobacteria bacterium]
LKGGYDLLMNTKDNEKKGMCARCPGTVCYPLAGTNDPLPELETAPDFCPMRRLSTVVEAAANEYARPEIKEFSRLASVQEAECYEITAEGIRTTIPRIEEIIEFASKCNYRKIGIAFCVGLKEEARMTTAIFEDKGFEVISVNCKVGRIPKETIGLGGDEKIMGEALFEPICNPIAQAEILNAEEVDLAILLGLCVGHDTLFFKYCRVPCTVLAVKDRVFGHNPLAGLYLSKSPYYGRIRAKADKAGKGNKVTV